MARTRARLSVRGLAETGTAGRHQQGTGFWGSYLLRRATGKEVEFVTVMLLDSMEMIRAAMGEDYELLLSPRGDAIPDPLRRKVGASTRLHQ